MKRQQLSPKIRLVIALGSAARNINNVQHRIAAAREAQTIPLSAAERFNRGPHGRMARAARAILASLDTLEPERLTEAAQAMANYADALAAPSHRVFEETQLGHRRRSEARAVG